ncbi:MAG: neuraminidase-like domain-containing protein, partial [Nannocystaceae bacterium]
TQRSPERPVWLLFHEAAESHDDIPAQLLRHMGVDIRHRDLVVRYFDAGQAPLHYAVTSNDLVDERWAVRVWRANDLVRGVRQQFLTRDIREARPYLWASDGPEVSGLENLTKFYRDGCISNGEPRRYLEIKRLNDGLRARGRAALLAYLTRMNRVALPWGGFATAASELSELLLLDVEVGLCQKAARIEEATSSAQLFVSRARLGLEQDFVPGPEFAAAYDRRLATFAAWQACKRRTIYRESWISWDADAVSSGSEAYQLLTSELHRADLTIPEPGGLTYGFDTNLPPHEGLKLLQAREPSTMTRLDPTRDGLGLLGTPDRHARASWLAPLGSGTSNDPSPGVPIPGAAGAAAEPNEPSLGVLESNVPGALTGADTSFPMWFEAAVRLGTNFVRVAAAATPASTTDYTPQCGVTRSSECCAQCGVIHPAHMDEYYFWVDVSKEFRPAEQLADWVSQAHLDDAKAGIATPETAWHDAEAL